MPCRKKASAASLLPCRYGSGYQLFRFRHGERRKQPWEHRHSGHVVARHRKSRTGLRSRCCRNREDPSKPLICRDSTASGGQHQSMGGVHPAGSGSPAKYLLNSLYHSKKVVPPRPVAANSGFTPRNPKPWEALACRKRCRLVFARSPAGLRHKKRPFPCPRQKPQIQGHSLGIRARTCAAVTQGKVVVVKASG